MVDHWSEPASKNGAPKVSRHLSGVTHFTETKFNDYAYVIISAAQPFSGINACGSTCDPKPEISVASVIL
jgi:hypothetical protein